MVTWSLHKELENRILEWADMPRDVWDSLCIRHKQAVTHEYLIEADEMEICIFVRPCAWRATSTDNWCKHKEAYHA